MKNLLRKLIKALSSFRDGKYAGKMIGLFDFCRQVICDNDNTYAGQVHERMKLKNIIPAEDKGVCHATLIEPTVK